MASEPERKRGYQELADFMAWDTNLALFPRFNSSNILCLLQMQAEICGLEERLKILGRINNESSDDTRKRLCYDWSALKGLGSNCPEAKLLGELRNKLAEYSKLEPERTSFEIALKSH